MIDLCTVLTASIANVEHLFLEKYYACDRNSLDKGILITELGKCCFW